MVEQRFGKYGIYFENLCVFFFFFKNGPELVLLQARLCNSTVQDCIDRSSQLQRAEPDSGWLK